MRVLVTGAGGMLARALVPELRARGHEVAALDRAALDVTNAPTVEARLQVERPDAVVQCAAYTAVDAAESDEEGAFRVNADGARNVARACHGIGALFVYPSTDYVFDGTRREPYHPADPIRPLGAYGRSKAAGEEAAAEAGEALVVRTSWLYGRGGRNFVDTITRLAREREMLEVVDDQVGRPTWTGSLARTIADLMACGARGIFHATDGGAPVSWFGFAREILARQSIRTPVRAVASERFPTPAPRPPYSVLDCSTTETLVRRRLPDWKEALGCYLQRA